LQFLCSPGTLPSSFLRDVFLVPPSDTRAFSFVADAIVSKKTKVVPGMLYLLSFRWCLWSFLDPSSRLFVSIFTIGVIAIVPVDGSNDPYGEFECVVFLGFQAPPGPLPPEYLLLDLTDPHTPPTKNPKKPPPPPPPPTNPPHPQHLPAVLGRVFHGQPVQRFHSDYALEIGMRRCCPLLFLSRLIVLLHASATPPPPPFFFLFFQFAFLALFPLQQLKPHTQSHPATPARKSAPQLQLWKRVHWEILILAYSPH